MKFTLGEVLSVTTGRLLCDMDGVYRILNHMTGDSLMTHQLPRAYRACRKPLLAQFPQLAAVVVPEALSGADAVLAWLETQRAIYIDEFEVEPLESWKHIDPLTELEQMTDKPIIVVTP